MLQKICYIFIEDKDHMGKINSKLHSQYKPKWYFILLCLITSAILLYLCFTWFPLWLNIKSLPISAVILFAIAPFLYYTWILHNAQKADELEHDWQDALSERKALELRLASRFHDIVNCLKSNGLSEEGYLWELKSLQYYKTLDNFDVDFPQMVNDVFKEISDSYPDSLKSGPIPEHIRIIREELKQVQP